jgi:hypothetical protein
MTSFREQKVQQALEDLRTQKFPSARAAAKAHGVNYVTLNRRSKGGISKQEARLAQQLLSRHQEGLLVQWILHSEAGDIPPAMLKFEKWLFLLARYLVVLILWGITGSPEFYIDIQRSTLRWASGLMLYGSRIPLLTH